ncbi:MAG: chemotaxis protein CheA [Minisyncoccales bacterium]
MKDQKKYLKMFVSEAKENLEVLNNSLLKIEKKPNDKKSASELMRAAHTLKSSAAAMGHTQMSQLSHAIEDIFDGVRSGKSQFSSSNSNALFIAFDLIDKSLQEIKAGRSELDTVAVIEKLEEITKKQEDLKTHDMPEGAALAERPEAIQALEEIKVDIKTLDSLMNLSEELLVNRMRLSEILVKKKYEELPVAIDMLGRLVSDIQYNVMQARMIPLGQIFDRFPRMVRDLCNKEKKSADLEIEGGEIELDRTVIDKIGEPLIHLLRNAVDHGIETTGKIQLKAKREKGFVIIEVINDGNVLDIEAIKEAAKRKRIIDAQQAERLTKEEIMNLIYHPELSTSKNVTETSGRGIGLNIVKLGIESLGGTVSVESPIVDQEGGTKFILQLPLTIAIIQALLVKVAEEIYAIPITNVDRSVKVPRELIKKALDREVAIVKEKDIPLIRLNKLFNLKQLARNNLQLAKKESQNTKVKGQMSELVVIIKKPIVTSEGREEEKPIFGLVVDKLVSEQDIVIKPLTGILKQNKGFAGITILGDGHPALILDVATLI